jgi:peptidoglycan/LPS O-acetylase OafA/YrhL
MQSHANLTHLKYRKDIDGLRTVAVLSVVGFHAFPKIVTSGFIGVDIFFVISGYLISTIIFSSLEDERFSFIEFYARRIKRIFPALLLVLVASLVYGWYILLPDEFKQLGRHTAGGSGFVSNFILWNENGYFDNSAKTKPLLHLWSLAIEEQFYIFWPILLYFVWKIQWSFLKVTALIFIVSFATNIYLIQNDKIADFYSPISRFWELMVGGILAYISLHHNHLLGKFKNFQSVFGFVLLLIGLFVINEGSTFPGWWALFPTFASFFIISAGANTWLNKILLSNKVMAWLGLISYPLYLWHWPLLVWTEITTNSGTRSFKKIILVCISIFLSWLTYRFIEQKFRHSRTGISLLLLIGMIGTGILALGIAGNYLSPRHQSSALKKILAAKSDWEFPGNYLNRVPDYYLKYYIEEGTINKTAFIGDSNMEQYAPRIDYVLKNNIGKANSAVIFGNPYQGDLLRNIFEQQKNQQATIERLTRIMNDKFISTIVFAARWNKYEENFEKKDQIKNFENFIKLFPNKKIFIILTIPTGDELDPSNMIEGSRLGNLQVKNIKNITFNINRFQQNVKLAHSRLRELAMRTGAHVIDPLDTFCVDGICPIIDKDGNPLYKDSGHITASYARAKASFIDITLF